MSMISRQKQFYGDGNKLPNWESKLNDYIDSCRNRSFQWGKFDCVRFANGAFAAQYGMNVFPNFDYDDFESSCQVMMKFYKSIKIEKAVDQYLTRKDIRSLQRGDLALFNPKFSFGGHSVGGSLGVCCGTMISGVGMNGLEFMPTSEAMIGWSV